MRQQGLPANKFSVGHRFFDPSVSQHRGSLLWKYLMAAAIAVVRSRSQSFLAARLALGLFLVGVNLQGELHTFAVSGCFHHAADRGSGETIAAD